MQKKCWVATAKTYQDTKKYTKNGKLIGYIGLEEHKGHPDDAFNIALGIGDFMILERRKGYGTEVIQDLIHSNKDKYDLIYCFVDANNKGAIKFYKKLGKVYDEDGPNTNNQYYVTLWDNTKKLEESLRMTMYRLRKQRKMKEEASKAENQADVDTAEKDADKKKQIKKIAATAAALTTLGAIGGGLSAKVAGINSLPAKLATVGLGGLCGFAYTGELLDASNDCRKKNKKDEADAKTKEADTPITESLILYVDDLYLSEGMCSDYLYMQLLDKNGFKVTENNIRILKEALYNGHIKLIEKKRIGD